MTPRGTRPVCMPCATMLLCKASSHLALTHYPPDPQRASLMLPSKVGSVGPLRGHTPTRPIPPAQIERPRTRNCRWLFIVLSPSIATQACQHGTRAQSCLTITCNSSYKRSRQSTPEAVDTPPPFIRTQWPKHRHPATPAQEMGTTELSGGVPEWRVGGGGIGQN